MPEICNEVKLKLALVTCAKLPQLSADDRLLLPELHARGFNPIPVIWDDPEALWQSFDAILVRSCWDYFVKYQAFGEWLTSMESLGRPVFNAPGLMKWNSNKIYLRELETRGIPVVPTQWILPGFEKHIDEFEKEIRWGQIVVKPTVSADAFLTFRLDKNQWSSVTSKIEDAARQTGIMIQPFLQDILTAGEWSLVYFSGQFSHALLKKPTKGDFRVQNGYGGTAEPAEAPGAVRQLADAIVKKTGPAPLYARVDLVTLKGTPHLAELELLEPSLFFETDGKAPFRFVQALELALKK